MEIGDLVQLSAYGKKLKILEEFRDDIGLMVSMGIVMWSSRPGYRCPVNRRDIKKMKVN